MPFVFLLAFGPFVRERADPSARNRDDMPVGSLELHQMGVTIARRAVIRRAAHEYWIARHATGPQRPARAYPGLIGSKSPEMNG